MGALVWKELVPKDLVAPWGARCCTLQSRGQAIRRLSWKFGGQRAAAWGCLSAGYVAAGEAFRVGFPPKGGVSEEALHPAHGQTLPVGPFAVAGDTSQEVLSGTAAISCSLQPLGDSTLWQGENLAKGTAFLAKTWLQQIAYCRGWELANKRPLSCISYENIIVWDILNIGCSILRCLCILICRSLPLAVPAIWFPFPAGILFQATSHS